MCSAIAGRAVLVKLGDFATARALDSSNPVASTAGSRLTLAPEVEDYGWVAWDCVLCNDVCNGGVGYKERWWRLG